MLLRAHSFAYEVVDIKQYEEKDNEDVRIYRDVTLDCGKSGRALFTISVPKEIPKEGVPCVLIIGGLMTGRDRLRFIPDHGPFALGAFAYGETLKKLRKFKVLWNLFAVRNAVMDVCPQLLAVTEFLEKQPWMGADPIDVMGYSFGSLFVPSTYVRAEEKGLKLGSAVMCYGGAGIYCLLKANLKVPQFLRRPVAEMASAFFKPMDPLLFAPKMKGRFLILNGIYDKQIPFGCAQRLQESIPEPKTVINLETEHMSAKNTELTLRLINISRVWLDEQRHMSDPSATIKGRLK